MKKMKILTLLLCASLAFAYMGCSNSSGGSDSGTSTPFGNNGNGNSGETGASGGSGGSGTGSETGASGDSGTGTGTGGTGESGSGSETGGGQQGGGGNSNSTPYTKVSTQTIGETTYDIVTFGSFPQSEKTNNITVDESNSTTVGSYTYYKGSDNEWYAKVSSNYYKVEPIKWRVLTTDYNGSGKKLLLAENILINKAYDDDSSNYENSSIRAYLTGDFLTTAFTQTEQAAIATTTVINNARSTNPDSNDKQWNSGNNRYASDISTQDKIFLLSEQEVTKADYGFAAYNASGAGNTRIRMTTAFAHANGAYQNSTTGYGGEWWLRSPYYYYSGNAHYVPLSGDASSNYGVSYDDNGVVPALCIN